MKSYAKNYIDLIRIGGENSEGLHRKVQKQFAGPEPGGRRGLKRVLREAQCVDRGNRIIIQEPRAGSAL
jgi:hypothetical protein